MEIIEESIFPEQAVEYAGFWKRFWASFVDRLVLCIPNLMIQYGMKYFIEGLMGSIVAIVLQYLIGWIYSASMESGNNKATIGKQAVGIMVTDLNGGRLTFSAASTRYWSKIISGLILLIGYFMMLWDDKKQTLHDKLAGAVVIMKQ